MKLFIAFLLQFYMREYIPNSVTWAQNGKIRLFLNVGFYLQRCTLYIDFSGFRTKATQQKPVYLFCDPAGDAGWV